MTALQRAWQWLNSGSRAASAVDVVLVWSVVALVAAWPVPDVNEPHYLCKAKHFWEPEWCARDLFLESADSHAVFYATLGSVTHLLPLPTAALVGRFVVWLATAWGWRRLSVVVAPRFGCAALSMAAALAINRWGSMAGEWFIGGLEAKPLAYALVFCALADVLSSRWRAALLWLGAATAVHVVVGGWTALAVGFVWLTSRGDRPSLRHLAPALAASAALAAFGLIPGLLLTRGVDAATVDEANVLVVGRRLVHHLYPPDFIGKYGVYFATMYAVYGAWCLVIPADSPRRRLRWFVVAALGVCGVGLAIAFAGPGPTPWAARLLKYYWFRLADVAAPIALALELAAIAATSVTAVAPRRQRLGAACSLLLMAGLGAWLLGTVANERRALIAPRGDRLQSPLEHPDWLLMCDWIRRETPTDALFITPRLFQSFKWHTGRAEFATWKDMPQDAASQVEWIHRIDALHQTNYLWFQYMPLEPLLEICRRYDVDYLLAYREPTIALPEVYRNNTFVIYAVPFSARTGAARP